MQITLKVDGYTLQTIASTIRNSSYGQDKVIKVWQDRRVYVNTRGGHTDCYIEIDGSTLTLRNMLKATGKLNEIAAILADGPGCNAVQPAALPVAAHDLRVAAPAARSIGKAQAWDNLYNEGYRDGGYNPYRKLGEVSEFRSARELSRRMVAEGGDRY